MDPENSAVPPSSTGQKPDTSAGSLYAQITAEDNVQSAQPKKPKASLFVQSAVQLMKITFYIDSVKRTHEALFLALSAIWAVFMFCIYLGGTLTLLFGVYHLMQLPLVIEGQLKERGLEFDKIEMTDYALNRIEVANLRDKKGRYKVSKLIINSTFADFLRKRIRSVSLDELTFHVISKDGHALFKQLPSILSELKQPSKGSLGLTIDGVNISNAVVNFSQGQMTLPVSFHVTGVYAGKTEVAVGVEVKQPNFSFVGTLITSSEKMSDWVLNIQKGSVTLPKRSPEDLTGSIRFKATDTAIETIEAELHLQSGTLEKKINAVLTRTSDTGMNASIVLTENNLNEPDLSNQIRLSFGELIFGQHGLESHRPIQIYVQAFNNPLMKIRDLHTVVNGDLVCPNWSACTFHLREPAAVTMQESHWTYLGKSVHGVTDNSFSLLPSSDTAYFSFYDPYLKLNCKLGNVNFSGYLESEEDPISVQALALNITGYFSNAQNESSQLGFSSEGVKLSMNKLQFIDGDISVSDILSPTREVQVMARQIRYETLPILTTPFDAKLAMVGNQATIRLQPENSQVIIALDGKFLPFQSAFAGTIKIPEFDLSKTTLPLGGLTPILGSNISGMSGKVAVSGRLIWKGANSMTGPLTLAAKDISFKWGGTTVHNLNAVLDITSLVPFATSSSQRISVGLVDSIVPMTSTIVTFQFENQTLRLMGVNTHVGGVELSMPASIVPVRNPNIVLFLKDVDPINLAKFSSALNIPQVSVLQGTGSVTIPLEIKDSKVEIPSLTFKISNATLANKQNAWPNVFNGDRNYIIRTGQITLNKKREMQISLDGRLLPSRSAKVVELRRVPLPEHVFKKSVMALPPKSILNAQKPFFGE